MTTCRNFDISSLFVVVVVIVNGTHRPGCYSVVSPSPLLLVVLQRSTGPADRADPLLNSRATETEPNETEYPPGRATSDY